MTPLTTSPLPGTVWDPLYPDSDGVPMAETPFHIIAMIWLFEGLQDWFAARTDVFLSANLFMYYEQTVTERRVAPDVLVAKGVGNHMRRSFRLWEELAVPCTLFELSSEDTWRTDQTDKRQLYAQLGVAEYFLFDPENRYLKPPLQGFRLENGVSMPIPADPDGSLVSVELGLRLRREGGMLRLIDLRTGQPIPTRKERIEQERRRADEEGRQREQEKQRAEQEKQRAEQEKQRAEQEKQRAEQEKQRAELERQRGDAQTQRAEQEKQRADRLEAELARLRALMPPETRGE